MKFTLLFVSLLSIFFGAAQGDYTFPEQISAAAKEVCCDLVITWVTFDSTNASQVKFVVHGSASVPTLATGSMTKFTDNGDEHVVRYIHRVDLAGLSPSTSYDYNCGSPANWSNLITVTTLGNSSSAMVLAVYGDLGTTNDVSLPSLISDVDQGLIQGVLHVGDMAYDMYMDNGRNGDAFMNNIQPVASRIPYMVCPGNHEKKDNFSEYVNRFSMPGSTDSLYYSWDIGLLHVISLCTEFYFDSTLDPHLADYQHRWLQEDLQKANDPAQRAKHPWVISLGHRPMYCTTYGYDDCNNVKSKVRLDFEDLLYKGGVDISFWGHNHIYQRQWPLYNYKVMNGSNPDNPYEDAGGLIHIITGAAGNHEKLSEFLPNQPDYVALNSRDYSYTRMTVHNVTHTSLEQISTDQQKGKVVDQIVVVKNHHGPRG